MRCESAHCGVAQQAPHKSKQQSSAPCQLEHKSPGQCLCAIGSFLRHHLCGKRSSLLHCYDNDDQIPDQITADANTTSTEFEEPVKVFVQSISGGA